MDKLEVVASDHPEKSMETSQVCPSPETNPEQGKLRPGQEAGKKRKAADTNPSLETSSPFPEPHHPTDFQYDHTKWSMLEKWITKNELFVSVGLVPVVKCLTSVSCENLGLLSSPTGWLSDEWHDLDKDLCAYVFGVNDNWASKPWQNCDRVFGIQNIENEHLVAYEYDFRRKEVKVYDSLKKTLPDRCERLFQKHAKLILSLYNHGCVREEDVLEPFVPFKVRLMDGPQQTNGNDCRVYAIKIVQALAMEAEMNTLEPDKFPGFKRKLAIDLVKWTKTPEGKYFYVEHQQAPRDV
ncbi:hypothetical protein LIER_32375 [Lithospermum erythrorhizon]|uniref:Ubiquitin-like protease family profile domain-containing protein n=1 Tax=Lithospermum erythrorhizon TaxID=34254 RepID=A0AAV3RXP7_LITER